MSSFQEISSQALEICKDEYVYQVLFLGRGKDKLLFVATTSNSALTYLTLTTFPTLHLEAIETINNVHGGLTCACLITEATDQKNAVFMTGGRDCKVKIWEPASSKLLAILDAREHDTDLEASPPLTCNTDNNEPIQSLAYQPDLGLIAAGTHTDREGTGDVAVVLWKFNDKDPRPVRRFQDIHANTVSSLLFHPQQHNLLISGSTDSTVSVTNMAEPDSDSAQLSSIVHAAPVQHIAPFATAAGGLGLAAISDDERLAPYALAPDGLEPVSTSATDRAVHDALDLDYTAWLRAVSPSAGTVLLCAGKNKSMPPHVDAADAKPPYVLVAEVDAADGGAAMVLARLEGAHGDDVVRDVWWERGGGVALSAGEDGFVRVWAERTAPAAVSGKANSQKKKADGAGSRFKPY